MASPPVNIAEGRGDVAFESPLTGCWPGHASCSFSSSWTTLRSELKGVAMRGHPGLLSGPSGGVRRSLKGRNHPPTRRDHEQALRDSVAGGRPGTDWRQYCVGSRSPDGGDTAGRAGTDSRSRYRHRDEAWPAPLPQPLVTQPAPQISDVFDTHLTLKSGEPILCRVLD